MYKTSGRVLKWLGLLAEFALGQVASRELVSVLRPIDNGPQEDAISPGYVAQNIG
jgi:hypothetical protein